MREYFIFLLIIWNFCLFYILLAKYIAKINLQISEINLIWYFALFWRLCTIVFIKIKANLLIKPKNLINLVSRPDKVLLVNTKN